MQLHRLADPEHIFIAETFPPSRTALLKTEPVATALADGTTGSPQSLSLCSLALCSLRLSLVRAVPDGTGE